jgi:hypothetical protein
LPIHWHLADVPLADHETSMYGTPTSTNSGALALAGQLEQIVEVYQRIPSGRLVILGQAGSGKTVLLMQLALDLLSARAPADPVPVIFSLGSWNPAAASLRGWLISQLLRDYPGLDRTGPGGARLAAELLDADQILPLLDGFDEIAAEVREPALEALNATGMRLVVTSRTDEYAAAVAATAPLGAAAAIELDDLTLDDLAGYLPRTAPRNVRAWEQLLDRLQNDPAGAVVRRVLATPLMVFLARKVYSDTPGRDPVEMLDLDRFGNPQALADHLLDSFVSAVYPPRPRDQAPLGRRRPRYRDPDRTQHWLRYLARHSDGRNIAWWKLGNTVPRYQRLLIFGLAIGLIGGSTGYVLFGPRFAPQGGVVGVAVGGLFGWSSGLTPLRLQLKIRGRAKQIVGKIGIGLLYGLVAALLGWPAVQAWGWFALSGAGAVAGGLAGAFGDWLRRAEPSANAFHDEAAQGGAGGLGAGLIVGLVGWAGQVPTGQQGQWIALGLAVGLAYGLTNGLTAPIKIETVVSPSSVLADDRTFTIFYSSMVGLTFGLVFGCMTGPVTGIVDGLVLATGYAASMQSWGRWLILTNFWLPLTGRLPWAVMAFVEDAHQRGVLRQSGAVYQFRHARLQDRIANQPR